MAKLPADFLDLIRCIFFNPYTKPQKLICYQLCNMYANFPTAQN